MKQIITILVFSISISSNAQTTWEKVVIDSNVSVSFPEKPEKNQPAAENIS